MLTWKQVLFLKQCHKVLSDDLHVSAVGDGADTKKEETGAQELVKHTSYIYRGQGKVRLGQEASFTD